MEGILGNYQQEFSFFSFFFLINKDKQTIKATSLCSPDLLELAFNSDPLWPVSCFPGCLLPTAHKWNQRGNPVSWLHPSLGPDFRR